MHMLIALNAYTSTTQICRTCTGPLVYTYLGCYWDKSGPYQLGDVQRNLPALVEGRADFSMAECAAAARDRGYAVFALQYFGQCFLGSVADVTRMDGASLKVPDDMCVNVPCVISGSPCNGLFNRAFSLDGLRAPAEEVEA